MSFMCKNDVTPSNAVNDVIFQLQMTSASKISPRAIKIVSEYDQEILQSQTADNPVAPRERAAQPSRDTRKTN